MNTEERLSRLERKSRWLTRLGALALAVGAIVVLVGQGKDEGPQRLVAPSLRIVNEDGDVRVLVEAGRIALFDEKGKRRLAFVVQDDGEPWASLLDENEETRLALRRSRIDLYEAHDRQDTRICLWKETSAPEPDAGPEFGVPGEYSLRAQLSSDVMALYDADLKVIWKAPGE